MRKRNFAFVLRHHHHYLEEKKEDNKLPERKKRNTGQTAQMPSSFVEEKEFVAIAVCRFFEGKLLKWPLPATLPSTVTGSVNRWVLEK